MPVGQLETRSARYSETRVSVEFGHQSLEEVRPDGDIGVKLHNDLRDLSESRQTDVEGRDVPTGPATRRERLITLGRGRAHRNPWLCV